MGGIKNKSRQCHSFGVKHHGNEYITIIIAPLRGSELNSPALKKENDSSYLCH